MLQLAGCKGCFSVIYSFLCYLSMILTHTHSLQSFIYCFHAFVHWTLLTQTYLLALGNFYNCIVLWSWDRRAAKLSPRGRSCLLVEEARQRSVHKIFLSDSALTMEVMIKSQTIPHTVFSALPPATMTLFHSKLVATLWDWNTKQSREQLLVGASWVLKEGFNAPRGIMLSTDKYSPWQKNLLLPRR